MTDLKIPDATIILHNDFLSNPPSVKDVLEQVTFNSDDESKVFVFGRYVNIPRKQVAYGDDGTFYRFSGNQVNAKPWSDVPIIQQLKEQIETKLLQTFNFVLVNYYKDGESVIGLHADDEKDLIKNSIIASYTIGETRDFVVIHNKTKTRYVIPLPHNTMLVMKGKTQKNTKHMLPKRKRVKGPRINFTFRQMVVED